MHKPEAIKVWNQLFPALPNSIIPVNLKENLTPDELIILVTENISMMHKSWTNSIRQLGTRGRLEMHEDDESDELFRYTQIVGAIKNAKN